MRIKVTECSFWHVSVWLSAEDTYNWAHKTGAAWPCSTLSGKRLVASFDRNGLCDLAINGKDTDCDSNEFNAIMADLVGAKLPKNHPCAIYFNQ